MKQQLLSLWRRVKKPALVCGVLLAMVVLGAGCEAVTDVSDSGVLADLLGTRSESLNIVLVLTVLSLLPSILIMLTGFTRIIIVLSLIRNALGTQQMPPNQVLIGLALFLTLFIMGPVVDQINETAYRPYIEEEIELDEAVDNAMVPIREFMLAQTNPSDLNMFLGISENSSGEAIDVEEYEDIPSRVLIPAFLTSEIKRGFQIGFFLYIPFIVVDMVVASTLMAMGMMMLPPVTISLPFKLLLFVLVDGWTLTVQSLITSFH